MSEEKESIVIDISNIDTKSVKKQEYFLQQKGFNDVKELLKKELKGKKNKDSSILQRSHNSIFINGKRGSGKTQFLISIKNYLKKNNQKIFKKLYFLESIDPTLLHDNESFLTIILAQVLNQLEEESLLQNLNKKEKSNFYKQLNNISSAIDGIIHQHNSKNTSLEHISQDQTSLRLEKYINEFFYKITEITKTQKIIILIDDIDMAFDKGFEVLEVIRKYLSSSHIIPIVTGDKKLYENIVLNHFSVFNKERNRGTTINNIRIDENNKGDIEFSRSNEEALYFQLMKDYLIKIFPLDKRVNILTLYDLAKNIKINFKYNENNSYYLNRQEETKSYFYQQGLHLFHNSGSSAKIFEETLFNTPLRVVLQYLHGEYKFKLKNQKEQFSLNNIEDLQSIYDKYTLDLRTAADKPSLYRDEGLFQFQNNNFEKAIDLFNKSLEIIKTEESYYYLANSYYNLAMWSNAEKTYRKVVKINPNHADALFKLGATLRKMQRYEEAEEFYIDSLEINPDNDNAYNQLGICYLHLKMAKQAINSFERAIEINPNNNKPYINIIETSFLTNTPYSTIIVGEANLVLLL